MKRGFKLLQNTIIISYSRDGLELHTIKEGVVSKELIEGLEFSKLVRILSNHIAEMNIKNVILSGNIASSRAFGDWLENYFYTYNNEMRIKARDTGKRFTNVDKVNFVKTCDFLVLCD